MATPGCAWPTTRICGRSTLFDELTALGYAGSYPSFTRALRTRKLRPHCEPCAASRARDAGLIAHPPGAETGYSSNDPLAWAPDCSRGPRPLCAARVAATCRPTRPGGGRGRVLLGTCLLYTSPSPRDRTRSRMP